MTAKAAAELTIERLNGTGEGVALREGERIAVPFALPGERVRVELPTKSGQPARLLERFTSAAERVEPPCPHFGRCGGCAVQHLSPEAEGRWKTDRIRAALDRHGVAAPPFAPMLRVPDNDRRRAELAFRRLRGGTVLGFHARGSAEIVDMNRCFVLAPALLGLLPALRDCLDRLLKPGQAGDAYLLAGDSGLDLRLDLPDIPDLAGLERLAAFADAADLARLSWRSAGGSRGGGEPPVPVAERRPVRVLPGGIAVDIPAGAFLQASPVAEAAMIAAVLEALDDIPSVLDLFSGIGTFALPLAARGASVHALEGQAAAVAALAAAAGRAGFAGVTSERRDLALRPLGIAELARPWRGGLRSAAHRCGGTGGDHRRQYPAGRRRGLLQSVELRARRAAALQAGGFRLTRLQPIDQFIWSPHIELIGTFERRRP